MRLLKYSYKRSDHPIFNDWTMDEIDLQSFNLIVGKNAVGKSRTLRLPSAFADMITQNSSVYIGNWEFTFIADDNQKICYNINSSFKSIREKILVDGKSVLERDHKVTKLYSQTKQDFDEISPPDKKLVLHVRRDKREYPFLEHIVEWAEKTHTFKFGQVHPNSFAGGDRSEKHLKTMEDVPALIEELTDTSKKDVIDEFNEIGYDIENFYAKKEGDKDILYVREKKLTYDLRQNLLSQGMFRAISLITFIHYLTDRNNAKTIIVDDLCEGLDYERATKLGKLIFEKFRDRGVQLIVSSNDCFLMDVINIRYWNVLVRENARIRVYNYKNSKDKFDDFKYSGLSNSDLFSSDYLD
ncbi:AAA family ATPase [Desulfobacterales bacterium HSG2]|nr:AAA family ATPase [Desulfobacterales bacterium HSG2]